MTVLGKEAEASKINHAFIFTNDESKIASWAMGAMTIVVRPKVQILKCDNPLSHGSR